MSYNSNTTPPPGFHTPAQQLQYQYQRIQEADQERHHFVQTLMAHVTNLMQEKDEATRKLQRTEISCDHFQQLLDDARKAAETTQKAIEQQVVTSYIQDCDRFVLALIDGDVTLFNDDYVRNGASGGENAASDLNNALLDHLKTCDDFQHDFKIQIRIYCNLTGLAKAYCDAGVISSPLIFHKFVQGFNKTHELLEIIDAGDLKEAADSKIKATFNLYRRNLHCKHIIFGGSGDNSYAGFLRQMVSNATPTSPTLTLIKSVDFARDLQPLAVKLDTITLAQVFRDTKLISRKGSMEFTASTASAAWTTSKPATVTPSVNGTATALASLSVNKGSLATSKPKHPTIWVNSSNQRIDKPIPSVDRDLAIRLKKKKLCNRHHLRGDCDGFYCGHSHEGKLTEDEKRALRFVARSRPCQRGVWCEDPECVDGHRCAFADSCRNENCWFTEEMHHGADGAREKIVEERKVIVV